MLSQTFRTLLQSRMQVGLAAYAQQYPDIDQLVFEPNADDGELFFTNVFSFAARRRVCEIAYRNTLADLRKRADVLRPVLAAHGLAPARRSHQRRDALDPRRPRRSRRATPKPPRACAARWTMSTIWSRARTPRAERAVARPCWCESSRRGRDRACSVDITPSGEHAMAKLKKTAKTQDRPQAPPPAPSAQAQAEHLSKSLSESAQQIWLAGVGAFGRAQAEGTKLFEGLVKEGLNLEQTARKFAGGRADAVRDAVESRVGQARERAVDTWDRLEKVFEDRVQRALVKLGVPNRDDLTALADRVDALTAELRRVCAAPHHDLRRAGEGPGQARAQEGDEASKPSSDRIPRGIAAHSLSPPVQAVPSLPSPDGFGLAGFFAGMRYMAYSGCWRKMRHPASADPACLQRRRFWSPLS